MAKVVVYTLLIATFTVLLFLLSAKKQNQTQSVEGLISSRLGRRLEMPVFDPLVTRIERLSHEKEANTKTVEAAKEEEDDDMFEEYFSQERRLNTTMRIKFLFPLLDAAPRDGFVSLKELQTWMMQQTEATWVTEPPKSSSYKIKTRMVSLALKSTCLNFLSKILVINLVIFD